MKYISLTNRITMPGNIYRIKAILINRSKKDPMEKPSSVPKYVPAMRDNNWRET